MIEMIFDKYDTESDDDDDDGFPIVILLSSISIIFQSMQIVKII